MIPMRQSGATDPNAFLVAQPSSVTAAATRAPTRGRARTARQRQAEGNSAWLGEVAQQHGLGVPGDVILLGGASVADFRIRVAQSHARHDLTPSYWSLVGIVRDAGELVTAPVDSFADPSRVAATNAVTTIPLSGFDDAERYPNIAVLRFPGSSGSVLEAADRLASQRSIADLPALVVAWLGWVWGVEASPNPLLEGLGLPSAVLVEIAFGLVDVELTPGLASASSCPEAIWQSVKWWQDFYTQAVSGRPEGSAPSADTSPWGRYLVRQRAATYIEPAAAAR